MIYRFLKKQLTHFAKLGKSLQRRLDKALLRLAYRYLRGKGIAQAELDRFIELAGTSKR